jgi:hypothetical protein
VTQNEFIFKVYCGNSMAACNNFNLGAGEKAICAFGARSCTKYWYFAACLQTAGAEREGLRASLAAAAAASLFSIILSYRLVKRD